MTHEQNIQRQQMWLQIDRYLDEFYPEGKKSGQELAKAKLEPTQIRGLENLVVSTRRFSEIINYIKNQAGKQHKQAEPWRLVCNGLLQQLEQLETKGKEFGKDDPSLIIEAKLRLARGWAKQIVSHYLFERNAKPEIKD